MDFSKLKDKFKNPSSADVKNLLLGVLAILILLVILTSCGKSSEPPAYQQRAQVQYDQAPAPAPAPVYAPPAVVQAPQAPVIINQGGSDHTLSTALAAGAGAFVGSSLANSRNSHAPAYAPPQTVVNKTTIVRNYNTVAPAPAPVVPAPVAKPATIVPSYRPVPVTVKPTYKSTTSTPSYKSSATSVSTYRAPTITYKSSPSPNPSPSRR